MSQALSARIRCARCKQVKARSKFSSDASRKTGHFPWCMSCQGEHYKEHRFQDESAEPNGHICPVDDRVIRGHRNRRYCSARCKEKASALRQTFGLDIVDYRRLVEDAAGKCPLCKRRPTEWHVDHNHNTGEVTGVVCSACNVGALAFTYHDIEYAESVLAYLKETPAARLGIKAIAPEGKRRPSNLHRVWVHKRGRRK